MQLLCKNASAEIARLQDSIERLKSSNDEMAAFNIEEPDTVYEESIDENRSVM